MSEDDRVKAPHGGIDGIVEMLHVMEEGERSRLLASLAERDPALFEEIQKKMFTFPDLIALSAREIQALVAAVPSRKLALAFRRASEALREHFLSHLPRRTGESLIEEIDSLGPRRLSDIESAQAEVLQIAKTLEGQGKLLLRRRPRE